MCFVKLISVMFWLSLIFKVWRVLKGEEKIQNITTFNQEEFVFLQTIEIEVDGFGTKQFCNSDVSKIIKYNI